MSLFDGIPDRPKQHSKKKTTSKSPAFAKPRKTGRGEHRQERNDRISRDERRRVTDAYERGEIKFPDVSKEFQLCYCRNEGAQTDPRFGHKYHRGELGRFELEHHGRKNG